MFETTRRIANLPLATLNRVVGRLPLHEVGNQVRQVPMVGAVLDRFPIQQVVDGARRIPWVGGELTEAVQLLGRGIKPRPAAGERLWLDMPGALEEARRRTSDPFLLEHAERIIVDGVTRIPDAVDHDTCDAVVREFHEFCDRHADAAKEYKDEHGYHSRLTNLHMTSPAAMRVCMNPQVLSLLDFLFGYRTAGYTCLTFEKGSQQEIHSDAPFFRTEPEGYFFGVWTALEDVHPDAGPLIYYRGGHRVEIDREAIKAALPGRFDSMFHEYIRRLVEECKRRGMKTESPTMKKGDTLIWHPNLPHGGSPIADKRLTRKSIVFHYLPENVQVHLLESFFDASHVDHSKKPYQYRHHGTRLLMDAGGPVFAHNY